MEFADAAGFFDNQPVLDAYSGAQAFLAQPDVYDASTRDAATGWRRTMSTQSAVLPTRGCVKIGDDFYIAGRRVSDFFQGVKVRDNILLHPADFLVSVGPAAGFLSTPQTGTATYAGISWLKLRKDETLTSDLEAMYDVYFAAYETVTQGMLIKLPSGEYLRVAGIDLRPGGLNVVTAYHIGAALRTIPYTSSTGVYNPSTDAVGAAAPVNVAAVIEAYRTNYHFRNSAVEKFERADRIVTVKSTVIATPNPGDTLVDQSQTFRVLDRQSDGAGSWEIHVRPVV